MKNYIDTLKVKIQDKYVIWMLIVIFIIWFILWMEYKAYQIRSAMQNVFEWLWKAFNTGTDFSKSSATDEKITETIIAKWESYNTKKNIKLSVYSSENKGKQIDSFIWKQDATHTFYMVTLKWENIWKTPSNQSLYDVSLIMPDWTTYKWNDEQLPKDAPEWFWWCVSCSMNPWDKSIHAILFDINVPSIDWAKIKIDSMVFDL